MLVLKVPSKKPSKASKKATTSKKTATRRQMRGRGFKEFLGKANNFLRNSKLISTVGSALGAAGVPFASQIGNVAGSLGYGRRFIRGGALRLAGAGYRR